jgi:diadenylate cyclase
LIDVLVETARTLSQKHFGALIAIEREIGFRGLQETGVAMDAKVTPELLTTIFYPNTPLHDGGVVLRGDRVVAAGCVFPLTQRPGLGSELGMRHRAALGLSEETDAIVIIVSEETGMISVARQGHLLRELDADTLRTYLSRVLPRPMRSGNRLVDGVRKFISSLFSPRPTTASETGLATDNNVEETPSETEARR